MKSIRDVATRSEFYAVLFCVCVVLFAWPFWGTAVQEQFSSMFFYVFVVWTIAVAALFLATRYCNRDGADSRDEENR